MKDYLILSLSHGYALLINIVVVHLYAYISKFRKHGIYIIILKIQIDFVF